MTNPELLIKDVQPGGTILYDCGQPRCPRHAAFKETGRGTWVIGGACIGASLTIGETYAVPNGHRLVRQMVQPAYTCECRDYPNHTIFDVTRLGVALYETHRFLEEAQFPMYAVGVRAAGLVVEVGHVLTMITGGRCYYILRAHGASALDYNTADEALVALREDHAGRCERALIASVKGVAA